MHLSRGALRAIQVLAASGTAVVLTVAPANAVVDTTIFTTSIFLDSDGAADSMYLGCGGGKVTASGSPTTLDCAVTDSIRVDGNGGNDSIDLTGLEAADFPALAEVLLNAGDGIDTVKGSFFKDVIEAGSGDTVQGFGGDDLITGGETVLGGDGDDVVTDAFGTVNGGPGDDRFVNSGGGPFDGGPGFDTFSFDFTTVTAGLDIHLAVTDTVLNVSVPSAPPPNAIDLPSTGIEAYRLIMPPTGHPAFDSSAYNAGYVDIVGGPVDDVVVAGPGDDVLTGRAGNDQLKGGPGVDIIRAGSGDDTVDSRDGAVDRVDCGDGTDSVVADFDDVLTGCENVSLPQPVTGAIKGPKKVKQGVKAKFTFTSATPLATFQCKLDKKPWKACKSPYSVATKNLKASATGAKHVLRVRAVRSGVVDATPSKKIFKVVK